MPTPTHALHRTLVVPLAIALSSATPEARDPAGDPAQGAWLPRVQASIRAGEYAFSPREDERWSAPNRAHAVRTQVGPYALNGLAPGAWREARARPGPAGNR